MLLFILVACNGSVKFDTSTGMVTTGVGLSCSDVYLTGDQGKIKNRILIYGQSAFLNFNNIRGFKKENGRVYPGMEVRILDKDKKTVVHKDDLYKDQDGFDIDPLLLQTDFTAGRPMKSAEKYTLSVRIWDKKNTKSQFTAKVDFKLVHNIDIKVKTTDAECQEAYLFSDDQGKTIIDQWVGPREKVYLLMEGLEGFTEEEGMVAAGLSMLLTDAKGTKIIDEKDLLEDNPQSAESFKKQLAPNFRLAGDEIKNPVNCVIEVWDKKGNSRIKVETKVKLRAL